MGCLGCGGLGHAPGSGIRLLKNGLTLPALQASLGSLVAGSSLALVPVGSSSKLTPSDREKMKRQLEKDYSSVFVTAETMPALCYLNTIQQQKADKLWEWLPWRRILSEEQLLEVKSRRSRSGAGADAAPDEWDLEIAGAALRVQHLLETRSHAFAMVGACHLHSWVVYVKKFLSLYARKPSDMFRAPTVQEAEMADRAVLDEVLQLCFSGHSLDDALSHVVVDRDMLRHVLVERPKAVSVKAEKEKPIAPLPSAGLPPLPRKSDSKRQPSNLGGGRQTAKRRRNGECWLWVEGKCSNRACRFKHECALCGDKSHHAAVCPKQAPL